MNSADTVRRRAAALPPEQRRELLVQATMPLLLQHGTSVSTRQIAEAAGVAEGTIFRVFPDKDSLITAVVEAAFDPTPFEQELAQLPPELPLVERLTAAVDLLQRRIAALGQLMAAAGLTRPPGEAARTAQQRPPTSVEAIARLFDADRDALRRSPLQSAMLLRAMTIAGTHPMMVDEPIPPAEIVDLLLHGLVRTAAVVEPPAPTPPTHVEDPSC